jgi:hypothetical protein
MAPDRTYQEQLKDILNNNRMTFAWLCLALERVPGLVLRVPTDPNQVAPILARYELRIGEADGLVALSLHDKNPAHDAVDAEVTAPPEEVVPAPAPPAVEVPPAPAPQAPIQVAPNPQAAQPPQVRPGPGRPQAPPAPVPQNVAPVPQNVEPVSLEPPVVSPAAPAAPPPEPEGEESLPAFQPPNAE